MSGEIVPRQTIQTLVNARNKTLATFEQGHAALTGAFQIVGEARRYLNAATGRTSETVESYTHHMKSEEHAFLNAVKMPSVADYLKTARKVVDTRIWAHVIELTDLEKLMDKTAKEQFRQQLMEEPPEVTEDNIYATLQQFMLDSGTIFKRGIAECFSKLDRRFKSHDGWEIGARIILTRAFTEYGSWNYSTNHRDSFTDIERVFMVLDGNEPLPECDVLSQLRQTKRWGEATQCMIETDYFRVRAFKNGNAHIWFKRDDLLEKVNKLLGEYYGAPIPEDREPDPKTGLYDPKTLPAKRYGFFPTPDAAVDKVMEQVSLYQPREQAAPLRVLEPSAGTGQIASRIARHQERGQPRPVVDCVELQPHLAAQLEATRLYQRVVCADFLRLQPPRDLYDIVVMNPPFDRERDIDHVLHALKFLRPGGQLVAIMSAGTEFRNTKKSVAFRNLVEPMGERYGRLFIDLPERSFSDVGTNCNTVILRIRKPA